MKIGIIDADLISRTRHRFPNLACMKISTWHKNTGDEVALLQTYDGLERYDKVYISKVFTDTPVPDDVLNLQQVECGGTGFYFDEATDLPYEVEHSMPDYHLYDDFIREATERAVMKAKDAEGQEQIRKKMKSEFKAYTDYSIGFLTRGCFRKCPFCVNQKYDRVFKHSPLDEFYDPLRPKICLLDDNFLGYSQWKEMLGELERVGKPFKFKQGLDERLLTDEKAEALCNARYDGEITFAFDNLEDYPIVSEKLELLRRYSNKQFTFYVLSGFSSQDERDIESVFVRIQLLMQHRCLPYIMRYKDYKTSPLRGMYINLARWCNQPSFFKKKSFRQFCEMNGVGSASVRYMQEFEQKYPDIAKRYFDIKFEEEASKQTFDWR